MTSSISSQVNTHYSKLARETNEKHSNECQKVALSFGYSLDELSTIPSGANLGVSCGNPLALAGLKEGETVVDLGCGAGFDVFLAARKVGGSGLAIGVDMSADMLDRARSNASKSAITNVKFVESVITSIPLASNSSDCVISNCVINLVPESDKPLVFSEIHRLLKPGGRLAVSDILARKAIPERLLRDMSLYVGCISGASQVGEYEGYLRAAGFSGEFLCGIGVLVGCLLMRAYVPDVLIVDKKSDLNIYKENDLLLDSGAGGQKTAKPPCCAMPQESNAKAISGDENESSEQPSEDIDFNEWVGSYDIYAVKR
ncbi:S-adenosyl-L-methionine-dependent methyltransferase [Glarea lozoyensis ATCC 20868]|uniref:Arsenite methyltransferase n=1 Tax=Glarea lozoyensis (strain ATCC 20868 / MF5171) TaxID=1116229 RepID=S3DQT6_GLAL2|nr:S-adenosyl-L-methionine-dependent methyltransferase [Glarea lozoyensis ATCC 20868]EPE28818.1 S-adenosyl-L-methionine-dependent methyltransferase [Glarea lozoyensis ATCC 20868]